MTKHNSQEIRFSVWIHMKKIDLHLGHCFTKMRKFMRLKNILYTRLNLNKTVYKVSSKLWVKVDTQKLFKQNQFF